eukprot:gene16763-14891_t
MVPKKADEDFKPLHIHTIGRLGEWRFGQMSEAFVRLAAYESTDEELARGFG